MKQVMDRIRYAAKRATDAAQRARDSFPCRVWSLACLYAVSCLLAVSCSSIRYIGIETYNPASITFPKDVKSVLIVNNAFVQQEVPFVSTERKMPDSVSIAADSAVVDFCRVLGRQIAESPYFEDVRLYEGAYRTDTASSFDAKLTKNEIRRLCDDHDVDAVISLDKLVFSIREDVLKVTWMDAINDFRVEVSGVLRACLPEESTPMNTVYLLDTVTPQQMSEEDAVWTGAVLFPDPGRMLRKVAGYVAAEAHVHFVPYWSSDMRWYYVSPDSRWKEAAAFAAAERWEKASAIWESLYGKSSSWKAKARLASNLALTAELAGQMTSALQWATLSHQYFSDHLNENDAKVHLQKMYMDVLAQRITSEKILQQQVNE
jgi:hypothetical protein